MMRSENAFNSNAPGRQASPEAPTNSQAAWLVDSNRAAELLGISPRSLFELHATGKLPSLTIGRRRLFDLADLKAFVENAKKGGAR